MQNAALQSYHRRMHRVLDYIDTHLDDDLSLETLSRVAAFSKFHFHRQFASLFGLSVHRYVQLKRLKRASYRLAFRNNCELIEVAFDSGYQAPEAFARAFKARIGQTPSQFRDSPDWVPWQQAFAPIASVWSLSMSNAINFDDVEIVDFPTTAVGLLEHRGDPALLENSIQRFISWRKQEGLPPASNATFTILYDDPDSVGPRDYRTDLCVVTDKVITENEFGIVASEIPGGTCAMIRTHWSPTALKASIMALYADWLPQSGYTPRDYPPFVKRLNFFPDVPESDVEVELFIPLI
jgi:AraC family transcriptional regulator